MKESYREGVANHPGPSHADVIARWHPKRWTGVSVGWVLSSEIVWCREPTASGGTEGNNAACDSASAARPCGVKDPRHAEKLHAREPGDPVVARGQ